MKYIYIMVIALLISVTLTAQENESISVIQSPIAYSQGFIMLRHSADIEYWEIEILERNYSTLTEYDEEVVERFTVIGDNYFKIPEGYTQGNNTYIKITEKLQNGEENIEIDKVTLDPPEQYGVSSYLNKEWKCNGSTYAWGINHIVCTKNNNPYGSYFYLQSAVKSVSNTNPIIVTPYYQWFSPTQFETFVNSIYGQNGNLNINGVSYTEYYCIGNDLITSNFNGVNNTGVTNCINLIKLPYNSSDIKKDKDGIGITGVSYVYGIAKALGPWGGPNTVAGSTCLGTNSTTYGPSAGTNTIQWAMQLINTNSASKPSNCNKPDLMCSSAGGGVTSPGDFIAYDDFGPFGPPAYNWDTVNIVWLGDFLEDLLNPNRYSPGNWWEKYHSISLSKISGNASEVFSLKIEDVFSEDGLVNEVPLNLQGGLYSILVQAEDGSFVTLYKEFKDSENNSVNEEANFLVKTIFPVPVVEDEFSISLIASKNLVFTYNLFDFNMNLLYETKVEIKEGESSTISIRPNESIPNGLLLNKFIFEDGSQSSIITVK